MRLYHLYIAKRDQTCQSLTCCYIDNIDPPPPRIVNKTSQHCAGGRWVDPEDSTILYGT